MIREVYLIVFIAIIGEVSAWHNMEHSIVARIAENYANKLSMEKVLTVVELIGDKYKNTAKYLEAACWADEIKKEPDYEETIPWHYISREYSPDDTPTKAGAEKTNIILKLKSLIKEIDQNDISEKSVSSQMRFFIHLMGDIHQPFHNINFFDESFPNGDQSGTKFTVQLNNNGNVTSQSLHFFTDAAAGISSNSKDLPFTDDKYDEVNYLAKEIAKSCDDISLSGFKFEPEKWSQTSYEKAQDVYSTIKNMGILTEQQIKYIQLILKEQLCLAGKRLAISYSLIYDEFPPPSDFYVILIVFLALLTVVIVDEVIHGASCSKQRREYLGIENGKKKKVKFDFGNSKV